MKFRKIWTWQFRAFSSSRVFSYFGRFNIYLNMGSSYHGHRDNGDYGDGGDTNLTSSGPRSVTPRAPTNPLASSSTSRPANRPNPAAVNTPTPIHHCRLGFQ